MTAARTTTGALGRAIAVTRWRLALLVRSLRFVPPLLGELVAILVLFSTRPQAPASALAVSAASVFVVAVWCSTTASAGMSRAGRDLTVVSAGRGSTLAGEVLADGVAAGVAASLMVLGSTVVVRPTMGVAGWAIAVVAVTAAGLAGSALAELVSALRLEGPARFVLLAGAICLTFARATLVDGNVVAKTIAAVLPPVLGFAKGLDDFPDAIGATLLLSAACVGWAAIAVAIAAVIGARPIDRPAPD